MPLLVGWNSDEGSLFSARVKIPPDPHAYEQQLAGTFKDQAATALSLYPGGSGEDQIRKAVTTLMGDQIIRYGAWGWAEQAANAGHAAVYRYVFTRRPPDAPMLSVCPMTAPGVYYTAEIIYVFDNLAKMTGWRWDASDDRLTETVSTYWMNFAKFGNPNGPGAPEWPRYVAGGGGMVILLSQHVGPQPEAGRERYKFLGAFYGQQRIDP